MKKDFILEIYKNPKTVFSFKEIALILNETNSDALKAKIHYYVKTKKLEAIRRGIYAKPNYNAFECAANIYSPAYISLETVLQKEGIIFQHDRRIFVVSYTRRTIQVAEQCIVMRKIKNEILYNNTGIEICNNAPVAIKERAFLDALYLYKDYHFDNLRPLNREELKRLLNIYQSKTLTKRVEKLFTSC